MNDRKEYLKQYRISHKDKYREYNAKYRKTHLTTYDKLKEENEHLEHNWNELKKWLIEQEQRAWDEVSSTFGYVLDKMAELEEGGNND